MNETRKHLEVGDRVDVYFASGCTVFDAEILYEPCAPGDCWILRKRNEQLCYVQTFERMEDVFPDEEDAGEPRL